jgi:hypothetical protein
MMETGTVVGVVILGSIVLFLVFSSYILDNISKTPHKHSGTH